VANGPFIIITSGATGTGDGSIEYTVDANAKKAGRKGAIVVGKQKLFITQAGSP